MVPVLISTLVVAFLAIWVILIFVFDYRRRKAGKPSIFVEVCEEENRGKRLVKEYRRRYGNGNK